MPVVGCIADGALYRFENIPPDLLAPELANALMPEERPGLHVSDLTICPYAAVMQHRHDVYLPVEVCYRMARGKAWDELAMKYKRKHHIALYQSEYSRALGSQVIVGTPDIIDLTIKSIEDFKAPIRAWQTSPSQYVLQVNTYRWLSANEMEEWGIEIEKLYLNICGQTGYRQMEIEMWDDEEIETELRVRLMEYEEAQQQTKAKPCGNPKCYYCTNKAVYVERQD